MSDAEELREPYDYDAAVAAMLTLRINTPVGEWLSDEDLKLFGEYQQKAIDAHGEEWGNEYMLLAMMNIAWLAIQHLANLTGESQSAWLQRLAVEMRPPPGST
jgi:hypothetical protein